MLASSFRLVWEAAPGRFLASLAPQAVSAVVTGLQLIITRDLIAAVLATGSGGDLGRVGYLLGAMIGLSLVSSGAGLIQSQQQAMLGAIVERHTNSVLLDRIIAIDLKRFETPEFQDLVKDLCMHIAHSDPIALRREEVPEEVVAKEREIYAAQIDAKAGVSIDRVPFN